MKVLLPVEKDPPIKMLPGLAQPLSIIYGNLKNPEVFLMNQFVQMYVDNFAGTDTEVFNDFSKRTVNTFYLANDSFLDLLDIDTIPAETIKKKDPVTIIKEELQKGHYIFSTLNEYYIPGTYFYQKIDMFHTELIYGFDDEAESFYALVYDSNPKYTPVTISYHDFRNAYEKTEYPMNYFEAYKVKNGMDVKPDFNLCKSLLYDYIHSQNKFEKVKNTSMIYGMNVYDYLIELLNSRPDYKIDPRDFASLYEHKNIMYQRIKEFFKFPELAKQYEKVLMLSIGVRTRAYQCFKEGDNEQLRKRMQKMLMQMRVLEEKILPQVYDKIEISAEDLDKHKGPISKPGRPYTMDSIVKDFIYDLDVWSILEQYLPGISCASQLSIIYGMQLKAFVAFAQSYFCVPEENVQKFRQQIFALK